MTSMHHLSVEDEFVLKTLKKIPGRLGKLEYLNGLRDKDGDLRHWGLEKIHGVEQSRKALHTAYLKMLHEMLITPLREMWEEMIEICEANDKAPMEKTFVLRKAVLQSMPSELGKAQRAHLTLILDVLCSLAERESK